MDLDKEIEQLKIRLFLLQEKKAEEIREVVKEEKDRLKRLQKWCEEMVLDHHTIYLLDYNTNKYYNFYDRNNIGGQLTKHIHKELLKPEKQMNSNDIVYDKNNIIVIISNENLKRNTRMKISASIELMVETGRFEYVEF